MQRQRILFSAFRADQYADPDGYLTSLGLVLEQYPNEVVVYVTDPRTGVQRSCKWPPTISEIVEACDARVSELKRNERYANWGKNGIPHLPPPRDIRPTTEQLKEKYGENWGLSSEPSTPRTPAPTWDQIAATYAAEPSRLANLMHISEERRRLSQPMTDQHHEAAE